MGEHLFDSGERVETLTVAADEMRLARLGAIGDMADSGDLGYNGYTSPSAFLIHRCGMGLGDANREVFLARALQHMPYAAKLAAAGQLTVNQLEALARAQRRHPDDYAAEEPSVAEAATGLTLGDTRRLVQYWCQAHDQCGDGGESGPSRVFLAKTFGGRGRLDGDLDPETADLLGAALDSLISERVRTTPKDDLPAMSEMRGEALGEMARRHLDSDATPTDHGNRPHLAVVVDWETLTGRRPGGLSEFMDGTVIAPETVRRLACDAKVCRLLTGPKGEILDLGRTQRTVSPAQWRALRIRDRHCQFPGCRRPWRWCDAHHIESWTAHDGPSDLCNLCLLCRFHHTLVHEGGWTLSGTATDLTFTRPDGTILNHGPP
ncbi:MAG: DUF222 domain-containing protein [Acidimicrobiia bacterium]